MIGPTALVHFLIATIPLVSCLPHPGVERRSMFPTKWYHQRDHEVHSLFRRQGSDGSNLPAVGSPEWTAKWPTDPYANIPQQWLDALKVAVSSGAIPNIPNSVLKNGSPTYGDKDPNGPEICSGTFQCRGKNEIWDAPDDMIGLSVDDGPVSEPDASPRLYDFLKAQNQTMTHFMIGANIRDNPQVFLRAFKELDHDIGVHTWTHPYMTTLTNEKILAEIGWTLQIIHDSTGGRVPRYWRPPYGDADNRVRAIAFEIFGLTSVIWNRDTADWSLSSGGTTPEKIQAQFKEWLAGPRSPGLIILEHEIEGGPVTAFINALPLIRQHKEWTAISVARLFDNQPNGTWYLNSQNNTSPVTPMNVGIKNAAIPAPNASSAPPPAASTAAPNTPAAGAPPANTDAAAYTPAVPGKPTSTTVVVVTKTPNANSPNANVVKPSAAGAAIDVPSHLGLSALITVLSVLGGSALL